MEWQLLDHFALWIDETFGLQYQKHQRIPGQNAKIHSWQDNQRQQCQQHQEPQRYWQSSMGVYFVSLQSLLE